MPTAIRVSASLQVESKRRGAIRTVLGVGVLVVGLLIAAMMLWNRLHAEDRTPVFLADAVAAFNAKSATDGVGMYEPPLTVDEVISAINSKLPTLTDEKDQVKEIYEQIVATGQLPAGGELSPDYS